jgi:hypothetical protein
MSLGPNRGADLIGRANPPRTRPPSANAARTLWRQRVVTFEPSGPIGLEPVDRAEVTIVVDNFVDLLMAGGDEVRRYLAGDFGSRDQLIAEHGFSALVTVERRGGRSSILYDGGLTPTAHARNLDVLQVPVKELRALVVSHGHADHHGGLEALSVGTVGVGSRSSSTPRPGRNARSCSRPGARCGFRPQTGATSRPKESS